MNRKKDKEYLPVDVKGSGKKVLGLLTVVTINHTADTVQNWIDNNYRLFEVWKDHHFQKLDHQALTYLIRKRNKHLQGSTYKPIGMEDVCDTLLSLSV